MTDPAHLGSQSGDETLPTGMTVAMRALGLIATLFVFFLSINLMGDSLKVLTRGTAEGLLARAAENPFIGLLLGILATSIIQSSSTTTSIVVAFAASQTIGLSAAIPMIMGANIGTTVTNTMVSLTHVKRHQEFKRALAAGTVHDFFNILAVAVLFPLEITTHFLEHSALWLKEVVFGQSLGKVSGLKTLIKPLVKEASELFHYPGVTLAVALLVLFISLTVMVKLMRSLFISRMARALDRFLFRNAFSAFGVGVVFTIFVQSSSVTTSLAVPLVGAGILTLRQIFPYTLGANVGTTVTAFLAALALASVEGTAKAQVGVTVAVVHLLFNLVGIAVIYPIRAVPIWLAERLAIVTAGSRRRVLIFIALYFLAYIGPLVMFLVL